MPIGVGFFAAGLFAAGYGEPETLGQSPTSPLPDASTGAPQTCRYINPVTNDYVMLADGRLQGMTSVAQLVLIAIKDIDLSTLTEKGPNFKQAIASIVAGALAPLVAQKRVRIKQVVVLEPGKDQGLASVDGVDLTSGAPVQTTIGA